MSTKPYSPESEPRTPESGTSKAARRPIRLRYTQTATMVLVMLIIGSVPVAFGLGWWGLLVFVPILVAWYLLRRVGADITSESVVIRGPFYTRRVPRDDVAGLAVENERRIALLRRDGSTIVIPTARARDLSRLREILFNRSGENAS